MSSPLDFFFSLMHRGYFLWKEDSQAIFCKASFQPAGLTVRLGALHYSCPLMGLSISLVALFKTPISPFLQLVKVTLNGNTAIWWYHSLQFFIICKIPESALCPIIWSLIKMLKSTGPLSTLPVSGIQMDFVMLIMSPQAKGLISLFNLPSSQNHSSVSK